MPTLPEKGSWSPVWWTWILFCDLDMKTGEDGKPGMAARDAHQAQSNYDAGDRTGRPKSSPRFFELHGKAFNNTAAGAAAECRPVEPEPTASAAAKPQQ